MCGSYIFSEKIITLWISCFKLNFKFLNLYLAERRFCTKINHKASSPRLVDHGAPQGSSLGPLLLLLYANDYASQFETTLFADDTNSHLRLNNIDILHSLIKCEIDTINNWCYSIN